MRKPASWIRQVVERCAAEAGACDDAAAAFAEAITEAHLRGVETHGLRRVRPYIDRIRSGGVDGRAAPAVERRGAMLMIDGRNGIGHYVAKVAAGAVGDAARQHGVAIALVRGSNHFGFAGYYATIIAGRGQLGVATSNGQVCVAPAGTRRAVLSNNPLAIAAPLGQDGAYLEFDLATSVTSRANIVAAARRGGTLAEGLAQDSAGVPTRDPDRALAGSLLAFGGDRGFALLMSLEAMTGVLAGGCYGDLVSSKESAPSAPEGTCHTLMAIDLETALGTRTYSERLGDLIARIAGAPRREDAEPFRYPGERRWKLRAQRLRDGVPLQAEEIGDLVNLAGELGVDVS